MSEHSNKTFYQNKVSFNRNWNKKTGYLGVMFALVKTKDILCLLIRRQQLY